MYNLISELESSIGKEHLNVGRVYMVVAQSGFCTPHNRQIVLIPNHCTAYIFGASYLGVIAAKTLEPYIGWTGKFEER